MGILDQAISAALSWKPLATAQRSALLERTRRFAAGGKFERFKTSTQFDGTSRHPVWLESASI
jgi:hypothetical protein